jgi:hypothetical protein
MDRIPGSLIVSNESSAIGHGGSGTSAVVQMLGTLRWGGAPENSLGSWADLDGTLFICTLPVVIYVVDQIPGNAAACFTQVAICASSSSPSWMLI